MRISQLVNHLQTIRAAKGDLDVRIDADIFRDSMPRDVSSMRVQSFYVQDVQSINIGSYPNEGAVERVVLYVGNEPHLTLGGQGV